MMKKTLEPHLKVLHTGPAQYVNRPGIVRQAGEYIRAWGDRALISGGKRATASVESRLLKSLDKSGVAWRKHLFTGESSVAKINAIKAQAQKMKANLIIALGGGKSLDAGKLAAAELDLPVVCIPTVAATCAATTGLAVIYTDEGVYVRVMGQPRNPSLVLVDPEVITRTPGMYLRAGILDSLAKWFEGRAVLPGVKNPDVPTAAAFQLAEVLYKAQRNYAAEAVRLNAQKRVGEALVHTLDTVIYLTGVIQTLSRAVRFTSVAHSLQYGMTVIPESHSLLHGIKVGYSILVQLLVEKRPKKEFDDVAAFFQQLGLEPSFKALGLPYDQGVILRVAELTATNPDIGPITYPVDKFIVAAAIEKLERRFA